MKLSSFERSLSITVLSSFAPLASPNGLSIHEGEVDWVSGIEKFLTSATQKAQLGVRVSLLFFFAAPLFVLGKFRTLASSSIEERAEVMSRLLTHRVLIVRELALLIKLCACMAMFRVSSLRERTGFDGPARPVLKLHKLNVLAA
jgi:hypothetical protein